MKVGDQFAAFIEEASECTFKSQIFKFEASHVINSRPVDFGNGMWLLKGSPIPEVNNVVILEALRVYEESDGRVRPVLVRVVDWD